MMSLASRSRIALLCLSVTLPISASAAQGPALPTIAEVVHGRTEVVTYRGRPAVKLMPTPEMEGQDEDMLALLAGAPFQDGVIEVSVAGAPRPGMPADSRGFIGVSFRTGPHAAWSEVFYLRPTNGRATDQLRRNHAVQYASDPEFPWHRLRAEQPGVYESYADLEPGAWTALRIEVAGATARLYVNGAAQPALVVNDLKRGAGAGQIALWAHVETDAYFGPVRVTPRSAGSAPASPGAAVVEVAGPQFVALSVPDLAASSRWYSEVFGLRQVFADGAPDSRARVVLLASEALRVELGTFRDARPLRSLAGRELPPMLVHGIAKFGFFVRDLGATLALLRARGVTIEGEWLQRPAHLDPRDTSWTPNILVRDNSGNYLQFFELGR